MFFLDIINIVLVFNVFLEILGIGKILFLINVFSNIFFSMCEIDL